MLKPSSLQEPIACVKLNLVTYRRLNWQLHFGETPKWSEGVKFILVDVEPTQRDASKAALVLQGDAGQVAAQLQQQLSGLRISSWQKQIKEKVHSQQFERLNPATKLVY